MGRKGEGIRRMLEIGKKSKDKEEKNELRRKAEIKVNSENIED